ncbi:type III pantothenate kinase [Collinsella sp. zg1085]|uniref:type III pantothenate kinase n=1 Tax=Collinsella sp. zg1085 TaxID=2844380 RepID=UPI001C0D7C5A|nr:type III pantothenate kinase [Collinsella sp. zg1085]QWT17529.1 type III pantothenate kinase [Collinsella sp. zg1085]
MLLAVDMGNTQTALGLFDQDTLIQSWRMPTDRSFTKDELHLRLLGYFQLHKLSLDIVTGIAFAGVVPDLLRSWTLVAQELSLPIIQIGPDTALVTNVVAPNPAEVGADRIANATAAATLYGSPCIVVDFGTATNVDVINHTGAYIGGVIAPGIRVGLDALIARAARLASVPLEAPQHTIGTSTLEAVQSGTVIGAAAMAEGLIRRIQGELQTQTATSISTNAAAPTTTPAPTATSSTAHNKPATVIATGGLASVVATCTDVFDVVDQQLTLRGVHEIWKRMQAIRTAHSPQ